MNNKLVQESQTLLERMVASKQLSAINAESLRHVKTSVKTEDEVLRWLAQEYGLAYTTLDDVEPDR